MVKKHGDFLHTGLPKSFSKSFQPNYLILSIIIDSPFTYTFSKASHTRGFLPHSTLEQNSPSKNGDFSRHKSQKPFKHPSRMALLQNLQLAVHSASPPPVASPHVYQICVRFIRPAETPVRPFPDDTPNPCQAGCSVNGLNSFHPRGERVFAVRGVYKSFRHSFHHLPSSLFPQKAWKAMETAQIQPYSDLIASVCSAAVFLPDILQDILSSVFPPSQTFHCRLFYKSP